MAVSRTGQGAAKPIQRPPRKIAFALHATIKKFPPFFCALEETCKLAGGHFAKPLTSPQRMGIALNDVLAIETLENPVRDAIMATRSQVSGPGQICAWGRL
jgi:hypothetical protein